MLKEALEFFNELGKKSETPTVMNLDDQIDPKRLVFHNGIVHEYAVHPAPRCVRLDTLDSLLHYAGTRPGGSVWINDQEVVHVDGLDHRCRATFPLTDSAEIDCLRELCDEEWISQKHFVRAFRTTLKEASPEGFYSEFVRLDFKRRNDGRSVADHGKESLGKTVEAEVKSVDALPEFVSLRLPLYADRHLREPLLVRCWISIDPTREITPLHIHVDQNMLESARDKLMTDTAEKIAAELGHDEVFIGSPNP